MVAHKGFDEIERKKGPGEALVHSCTDQPDDACLLVLGSATSSSCERLGERRVTLIYSQGVDSEVARRCARVLPRS